MKIESGRFDGNSDLPEVAKSLGFDTVAELVLDRCVFPPATIVRETEARPIVNTVRAGAFEGHGPVAKYKYIAPAAVQKLWGMKATRDDALGVFTDDNMSAHFAFSACFTVKRDKKAIGTTQLCHVFHSQYSKHPRYFSCLANLVLVPWWLGKLTDVDPHACQALRFVARVGYGICPACDGTKGCPSCSKPDSINIDDGAAKQFVAKYEAYRVKDYRLAARAINDARWRKAIAAGTGYSEPLLRP